MCWIYGSLLIPTFPFDWDVSVDWQTINLNKSDTGCTHETVGKNVAAVGLSKLFPNSCMTLFFVELEQLAIVYRGLWSGL